MSKALKALESIRERVNTNDYGFCDPDAKMDAECDVIEKALKALEIIKTHVISPEYDASGIYVERSIGLGEPCYEIKLREGAMCCFTQEEYDLLKEVLWED